MNPSLTLFIPSDWPAQRRDCSWLLRDARGQLLQQGCSEPAHWPLPASSAGQAQATNNPPAQHEPLACHLVLCGEQVAGHAVALPKSALGRSPEVVAAALEDSLLDDANNLQFAVLPEAAAAGENATVGVISRQRLAAIGEMLKSLGLLPLSAWPLSLCLPAKTAALIDNELTLPLPAGGFVTLNNDAGLGDWLDALAHESVPFPLPCWVPGQHTTPEVQAQLAQTSAGRLQIIEAKTPLTVPGGAGFLYGDLAPPRAPMALARELKIALRLASGFALLIFFLASLQWGWLSWQAKQYRQEIETSFRIVSPQGAMVDPLLQMQRQVDTALHAAGQLRAGDFLRLLEALAELSAKQPNITELSFEKAHLRIAGELSEQDLQALKQRSRKLGLKLTVLTETKQAAGIRVDLEISEGNGR
ncbi:MAG: type II secretion system protein GspL [Rhodocyclaceae bacterium]|nr:type II secretion system protein GspL [Rhodocyclaceae bacterium]